MTVRPILVFPDARLRAPARAVTAFDDTLAALAADLLDTMRAAPGIGITAPHIGVPLRLVVLELPGWTAPRTYVNPAIRWASGDRISHQEGSISMPGMAETVERAARLRLGFQDLLGQEMEEEADGLHAVCHQHEIDQLDGIFWTARLSRLKRDRLLRKFARRPATV